MSHKHAQLMKYRSQNLVRHRTPAVQKVEKLLGELGIRYMREKGFMAGLERFYITDFYLPRPYRTVIEIDGPWHENTRDYDASRDRYLQDVRGFKVLRFTNGEVLDPGFDLGPVLKAANHNVASGRSTRHQRPT